MYGVYDIRNKEMCVGIFENAKETANFLNTSRERVYAAIRKKEVVKCKYRIVKVEVK